jgi:hypothetical protein
LKSSFLILLIIGLILLISFIFIDFKDENSEYPNNFETLLVKNIKQDNMPDIYYIILDEYAGNQSLKQNFNFNNTEFYDKLIKKGFFVSLKSYSNYPFTAFSIPSALNMQYFDSNNYSEIENTKTLDKIRYSLDNNLVMKNLNKNGYYIVSFFAGNEAIGNYNLINEKICGEKYFSSHNLAKIYPQERLKEKRNEILCTFENMGKVKDTTSQPIFVYTHFALPHDPFVLNENGDLQIFDETNFDYDDHKKSYIQQLKFANKMMIKVINEILSDETRDSIIIIQSDHGERTGINWINPTEKMIKQGLNNINAVYFPNNKNLVYDGMSNVNYFRVIFNEYFNAEFELLNDKYFWMDSDEPPFNIIDVTKIIENEDEF